MDPRAPEDMVAADEGMGTLRTADLVAVVVLREAPEVDPDLAAEEVLAALVAPVALADLEGQGAVAQETGRGTVTCLARVVAGGLSRLVEVGRHLAAIQVEVAPA